MGKLVPFEKREKGRSTVRPDRGRSAAILIFNGVRYERDESTAPTKPTASSGGTRKRV